jgi:hypothetical protein
MTTERHFDARSRFVCPVKASGLATPKVTAQSVYVFAAEPWPQISCVEESAPDEVRHAHAEAAEEDRRAHAEAADTRE